MKRGLAMLTVMLISFVAGVAVCFIVITYRSRKSPSPPAPVSEISRCPSAREVIATGKYVVISIPNDREFYIGKDSIALSDIPNRVRQLTSDLPVESRTVFLKGEPSVKYETLSAVINRVHDADVNRVEVVPNPKRPLQ